MRSEVVLQLLIGEPHEVIEARGNELVAVLQLEFELGSFRIRVKVVRDARKCPAFAKHLNRSLEVAVRCRFARLQAGGADYLLRRISMGAFNLDRDKLVRRGRQGAWRSLSSLSRRSAGGEDQTQRNSAKFHLATWAERLPVHKASVRGTVSAGLVAAATTTMAAPSVVPPPAASAATAAAATATPITAPIAAAVWTALLDRL